MSSHSWFQDLLTFVMLVLSFGTVCLQSFDSEIVRDFDAKWMQDAILQKSVCLRFWRTKLSDLCKSIPQNHQRMKRTVVFVFGESQLNPTKLHNGLCLIDDTCVCIGERTFFLFQRITIESHKITQRLVSD